MSAVKSIADEVVAVDGSDTPSGGAATPGGDPGQLQYHGEDGALAGIPESLFEPGGGLSLTLNDTAGDVGVTMGLSVGAPGYEAAQLSVGAALTNSYVMAERSRAEIAFEGENGTVSVQVLNDAIKLVGLQTYADNAAAISAGLVTDQAYRTPTGALMLVYEPE